jgi:hypothetical protein
VGDLVPLHDHRIVEQDRCAERTVDEEGLAGPEDGGDEIEDDAVDQALPQRLPADPAARDRDVALAGEGPRLLDRAADAVGDEGERRGVATGPAGRLLVARAASLKVTATSPFSYQSKSGPTVSSSAAMKPSRPMHSGQLIG